MAKQPDASAPERAYQALRTDLLAGRLRFRQRLDVNTIADDLAMSSTPVREALIRLRVERLVAFRPTHGFFVPLWSEEGLRALYRWRGELAMIAARQARALRATIAPSGAYPDRAAAVLNAFNATANGELVAAAQSADDRLARARAAETELWRGAEAELEALAAAAASQQLGRLQQMLRRYHEKRAASAGEIRDVAALMDLSDNGV